jgi:hypothetical protein
MHRPVCLFKQYGESIGDLPETPSTYMTFHTIRLHLVGFDEKLTGVNQSKILRDTLS